jgi:hypothetical protein
LLWRTENPDSGVTEVPVVKVAQAQIRMEVWLTKVLSRLALEDLRVDQALV